MGCFGGMLGRFGGLMLGRWLGCVWRKTTYGRWKKKFSPLIGPFTRDIYIYIIKIYILRDIRICYSYIHKMSGSDI